jgi:hypothetical protein
VFHPGGRPRSSDLFDPEVKTEIEVVDADPVQWYFDDRFGMH